MGQNRFVVKIIWKINLSYQISTVYLGEIEGDFIVSAFVFGKQE